MKELISKDIIRKQDAIDKLFPLKSKYVLEPIKDAVVAECIKEIDKIQAIESRQKGEWIEATTQDGWGIVHIKRCSECNQQRPPLRALSEYKFCPNCGADMRGEE